MTIQQSFSVTVQGSDDKAAGERQGEQISKTLRREMKAAVMEVLVDQKRPGGVLA